MRKNRTCKGQWRDWRGEKWLDGRRPMPGWRVAGGRGIRCARPVDGRVTSSDAQREPLDEGGLHFQHKAHKFHVVVDVQLPQDPGVMLRGGLHAYVERRGDLLLAPS